MPEALDTLRTALIDRYEGVLVKSKGEGHLTRINDILANLMETEHRTRFGR